MNMLERVARQIALTCYGGYPVSREEREKWPTWATCMDASRATIEAMAEPTDDVLKAGFRANTFENRHGDDWGCPGVECPPQPDWDDPKQINDYLGKPRCLVARVTISPEKAWRAMISACLTPKEG